MTWPDFQKLDLEKTVAILPVAAIEQHGPHLPVFVDACINKHLLEQALEAAPDELSILALPMQAVGKSDEHIAFPGTLTLTADTLTHMLIELGESVHRAGIRRLVLFNSHGGQPQIMDIVARTLRVRLNMFVVCVTWSNLGMPEGLFSDHELAYGIHGGEVETSLMLHYRPDLVHMENAIDFVPASVEVAEKFEQLTFEGAVGFGWQTQDLHPLGACGNAAAATAEKGEAVAAHTTSRLVSLLQEIVSYPLNRVRTEIGKA